VARDLELATHLADDGFVEILDYIRASPAAGLGLHSLPGVRLVTWTIPGVGIDHTYGASSTGVFDPMGCSLPLPGGCQIGYVDHTGCHHLVLSANPTLWRASASITRTRAWFRPWRGSAAGLDTPILTTTLFCTVKTRFG
jgi:hypothetical protein